MANLKPPRSFEELPLMIIKNMTALATSGFGVVVALAWNEAIKRSVEEFIDPYLGRNSGVVSLFIYATIMTLLAVLVTMQLAMLEKKLDEFNQKVAERKLKTAQVTAKKRTVNSKR